MRVASSIPPLLAAVAGAGLTLRLLQFTAAPTEPGPAWLPFAPLLWTTLLSLAVWHWWTRPLRLGHSRGPFWPTQCALMLALVAERLVSGLTRWAGPATPIMTVIRAWSAIVLIPAVVALVQAVQHVGAPSRTTRAFALAAAFFGIAAILVALPGLWPTVASVRLARGAPVVAIVAFWVTYTASWWRMTDALVVGAPLADA